jgi:YbgC/YbaW family acyl-CoA thioester hydrolase
MHYFLCKNQAGTPDFFNHYLKFIERGRSEYLRDLGFEQDVLIAKHNTIFAVRRLNAQYHLPVKFNGNWHNTPHHRCLYLHNKL